MFMTPPPTIILVILRVILLQRILSRYRLAEYPVMQQNSKLYGSQFIQSVFGQEHLNYDEFRDHQQG